MSAFLITLAVFAVGFVARPAGGLVFGWIGDRLGRKKSMTLSVSLIAGASFAIGISPTYAHVGWLASAILVTARLAQGLAYGGEQPAAQAYLSEAAPPARRGLWSTLIYFSGTLGAVAGLVLGAVLAAALPKTDMLAWGWRIPFIIAGAGGLFAFSMRSRMRETEQFVTEIAAAPGTPAAPKPNLLAEIWQHRRSAARVAGMTVGLTVVYYFWVVASSAYSIVVLKADPTHVLLASVAASLTFLIWLPLWGTLSDRIGRKPVMLTGILGSIAVIYPLSRLIDGNPVHLFAALAGAMVFLAAPCAISPAIMCELFPTRVRTAGVAVPLALAIAIFGGTTPYLQTWLSATAGPRAFIVYVIVLLAVSAVTVLTLPETRGRILDDTVDTGQAQPAVA